MSVPYGYPEYDKRDVAACIKAANDLAKMYGPVYSLKEPYQPVPTLGYAYRLFDSHVNNCGQLSDARIQIVAFPIIKRTKAGYKIIDKWAFTGPRERMIYDSHKSYVSEKPEWFLANFLWRKRYQYRISIQNAARAEAALQHLDDSSLKQRETNFY